VTHEALIHSWGTLREWIDSKREQLRVFRRLTDSAKEWEEAGREASYLYRGGRLEDVEKWPVSPGISLKSRELAFVQASLAQRQREDEQRRI
jgi:conflict system STAND superfamily ATPase